MSSTDTAFSGSIPALYDRFLGPLLFEPYAEDLAQRAAALAPRRLLETAAGTGIVTRELVRRLPDAALTVTDLNQAMLDVAAGAMSGANVSWRQADAQALPFPDAGFDMVVCQFGVMFFLEQKTAFEQARRVLRPGGHFLFNVWDRIDRNPVSAAAGAAVAALFPDDPPGFLERTPYGHHDRDRIGRLVEAAGFELETVDTVARRSCRPAAEAAAGLCLGTPMRSEIEARDPNRLDEAVAAATAAIARLGKADPVDATMSAHVFVARAI